MGKSGIVTNISSCFVQIFIKKMIKNKLLNKNILISTEHIRRKKSKNNYIDIEELQEIYELDTRPKYSSSWREFVKREINMTPALQEICEHA